MQKELWYVYIIECLNGRYYTGITKNVEERFKKHKSGKGARFTTRNPVKAVIYTKKCGRMSDALKKESEIKKLSRTEKENLVNSSISK